MQQRYRLNTEQLLDYHVASVNGVPIPLSTIARIASKTVPESLNHFQQQNSAASDRNMMISARANVTRKPLDSCTYCRDSPP